MKNTFNQTEKIISHVSEVEDKLFDRVEKIDFSVPVLNEGSLEDLKLHLGHAKAFSDLAKVQLSYYRAIQEQSQGKQISEEEDEPNDEV